jgi:hypothetical protein
MMTADLLDTKGNPFYKQAARALFIAKRDGNPVGRIAAIDNQAHNAFHQDRIGFFGFFEAIDDVDVARVLFDAASAWLKNRGLTSMRGPMNPSTNHDCGVLIEGEDERHQFLTSWNPPYYARLFSPNGFVPSKDLVGYWLPYGTEGYKTSDRFSRLAERAAQKMNLSFRDLQPSRFWQEVEIAWDVYNGAWEKNWGFVPMSHDEFMHMAKSLKTLLVPEFAFVAEVDGKPAGMMLCVPDFNEVFQHIPNGRLLPFGVFRILFGKSRIKTGRIMAMGIKAEYRSGSILPLFMHEAARRAIAYGSPGAEASWILEDNLSVRQPIEAFGAHLFKRWRIFDRPIV